MNMRRIVAKFLLSMPSDNQQQSLPYVCKDLKDKPEKDRSFLSKVFVFPEIKSCEMDEDSSISRRMKPNRRLCWTS
jgi:hypothetical protein